MDLEKIPANHIFDKRLIFRYIKNSDNSTNKRQPIQKQAKDLKRHFSKENKQMANKHMKKKCSASLIIRKTLTTTTVRFYFAPIRMAIIKHKTKQKITSAGEDVEKLGQWMLLVEMSSVRLLWETAWWFFKKLNSELPYGPAIRPLAKYSKELKAGDSRQVLLHPCSQQHYSQYPRQGSNSVPINR